MSRTAGRWAGRLVAAALALAPLAAAGGASVLASCARDQAGATMFYGHDPAQWETIPKAPAPVI